MKLYILFILIIILFYILKSSIKETFIEGNFSLCKPFDCDCRKMNTAPDGTCVNYKVSNKPSIPEYENKKYYKRYVVKNNLYPKKRKNDIVILIGKSILSKKQKYNNLPSILNSFQKTEYGIRSEDEETQKLLDIFIEAINILKYFDDGKNKYIKYILLDVNRLGKDREIINSLKLPLDKYPAVYLLNEASRKLIRFGYNPNENACFLLQDLLIFIANKDIGLISYLNHLQDPFLGIKFKHDTKDNKWIESPEGISTANNGTKMCKLIDYDDLPTDMKKNALENNY